MGGTSVILLSSLSVLFMLVHVQEAYVGYGGKPCPPGKEYDSCGSACPPTCDNMVPICMAMCKPGCFCKGKTVDNGRGKCVKRQDCCKGNMIYSECGNDCGRVCPTNKPTTIDCTSCFPGCFCKTGYRRLGDRCVHPKDCPRKPFHH
ncbi:cysteine-rich venom protein 1-like [Hyla sarda]|uniref:cysteine-rich venom protein 1-like n=1 Tax=Hyla sarda TaxID=327740 RepID=UPI0024C40CC9|nr:cysteine-rich venom protein 1-like [Hyla sarda]XP_056399431.1 cysteine-rich venom protein 1-like [Hyla sarda]